VERRGRAAIIIGSTRSQTTDAVAAASITRRTRLEDAALVRPAVAAGLTADPNDDHLVALARDASVQPAIFQLPSGCLTRTVGVDVGFRKLVAFPWLLVMSALLTVADPPLITTLWTCAC
jgi:hypothetical protein